MVRPSSRSAGAAMRQPTGTRRSLLRRATTPVVVQPVKEFSNASRRQRDAGIRRAVVEIDRVTVGADGVSARECDIADVSVALVIRFGPEDPRIPAKETLIGLVEREEG